MEPIIPPGSPQPSNNEDIYPALKVVTHNDNKYSHGFFFNSSHAELIMKRSVIKAFILVCIEAGIEECSQVIDLFSRCNFVFMYRAEQA